MKGAMDALTGEVLLANAIGQWHVGGWAGRRLRVGKVVHEDASIPSGLGPEVPGVAELSLVAKVACDDADTETRCVHLRTVLTPDAAALSAAFARVFTPPGGATARTVVGSVSDFIVEPGTLRPRRHDAVVSSETFLAALGKPEQSIRTQRKVSTTTWAW